MSYCPCSHSWSSHSWSCASPIPNPSLSRGASTASTCFAPHRTDYHSSGRSGKYLGSSRKLPLWDSTHSCLPKVLHTFDSSTARRRCDKRCTRSGGGRRPCLDHMEATEEMVAMVGSAAAAGALSGSIYRSHQQSIDHPRIQHSSPDRSTRDLHIAYPHSTLKKIDVARASRFKFAGAVCWRRTHHHEEGDERCRH